MNGSIFLRKKVYLFLTAIIIGACILFMIFSSLTSRFAAKNDVEAYELVLNTYESKLTDKNMKGRQKVCLMGEHSKELKEVLEFQKYEVLEWEKINILQHDPELMIVNAKCLNNQQMYDKFVQLLKRERYNVILYGLDQLIFTKEKKDLLGITMAGRLKNCTGLTVYDGFWKDALTVEEKYRYEALDIKVKNGRKVYIAEYKKEDDEEQADTMPLLYRQVVGESELYIVNGPLMNDFPQGIIRGVCSQLREDYLYPVSNVSYFVADCFPLLSDENKEGLDSKYLRNVRQLTEDILLPGVMLMSSNLKQKPTFLAQDYYKDNTKISPDMLTYVEKELSYWDGELGIKLTKENQEDWSQWLKQYVTEEKIYSISSDVRREEQEYLGEYIANISFDTDNVLPVNSVKKDEMGLNIVYDVLESDGKMRLNYISTVYGYGISALGIDMKNIFFNEKNDWNDVFEAASEQYSSCVHEMLLLEPSRASIAAEKILEYYLIEPFITYEQEKIKVYIDYFTEDAQFILRTEKKIDKVKNGSFKKLSDGNWLITFNKPLGEIILDESELIYPN